MNDYYREVSYYDGSNGFTLTGAILNPEVGGKPTWYTTQYNRNYYITHGSELYDEAISAAIANGFNPDNYDFICVIYAGEIQWNGDLWPQAHAWWYLTGEKYGGTFSHIGVHCHEFGHLLGLPDLYGSFFSSGNIGKWGLMGTGTWLGQKGNCPSHLCAQSKLRLGWVSPWVVNDDLDNEPIDYAESNKDMYKMEAGSGQYFLIEARKRIKFDQYIPGEGLLIYHINGRYVDIECADGLWETSQKLVADPSFGKDDLDFKSNYGDQYDPFYENNPNGTPSFTPFTNPCSNATFGGGQVSFTGIAIENIHTGENSMVADFLLNCRSGYVNHNLTWQWSKKVKMLSTNRTAIISLTGDVVVQNGATLTIEPYPSGSSSDTLAIEFAANSDDSDVYPGEVYTDKGELLITSGSKLKVDGGSNQRVKFRSDAPHPYDSDWVGITLKSNDNDILNSIIRDAIYGVYSQGSSGHPLSNNKVNSNTFRNIGSVAVYSYYSSGEIKNNAFYDNYSSVIYNYRSFSAIDDIPDIENNTIDARFSTGINNYSNSNPIIKGNNIKGSSSSSGTGINVNSSTPLILYNTIWTGMGNLGTGIAWGLSESDRGDEVRNNTIYGMAYYGIKSYCGRFHIVNNIITDGGYGIWAYGSSKPTNDYNDVWSNSTGNYYGISPGAHSISANPKFVNPSGGDFHLQPDSPCINAGDPRFTDADGSRSDMGAHPTGGIPKRRIPSLASSTIPDRFSISQNYPNPFNPATQIFYQLPRDSHVTIEIYNILGQKIITLVDRPEEAGYYNISWRGVDSAGREVPSGIYLYKIQAYSPEGGRFQQIKKMLLLR